MRVVCLLSDREGLGRSVVGFGAGYVLVALVHSFGSWKCDSLGRGYGIEQVVLLARWESDYASREKVEHSITSSNQSIKAMGVCLNK